MKVPKTLVDLYHDLRDRRLLPLVVLLLVTIVAAPILLSEKGDDKPTDATLPPAPVQTSPGAASEGSKLAVVKVDPGIRNPRKRLAGRQAKDPFVQKFTGSGSGGAARTQAPATTTTTTTGTTGPSSIRPPAETVSPPMPTTSTPTEVESAGSSGGGSPGSSPGSHSEEPAIRPPSPSSEDGTSPRHLTLFAFEIEVRITKHAQAPVTGTDSGAGPAAPTPVVKTGVPPATPLPGPKQPVVTYMGTKDGKTALLMISNEVSEVLGEGKCLSGTGNCQLIAVEPNEPEILVFGPNKVRYKIEVLGIEPVVTGHT